MEAIKDFLSTNPQYWNLLAAFGMTVLIIGLILDWDWLLEPGGGYFNIAYWVRVFGRKTVRIVFGAILFIGLLAFLYSFFSYDPDSTKG